jgi:transcription elongation factor Elf1
MSTIDTEHRDAPTCPHCGHEHEESFEWRFDGQGCRPESACDSCGQLFHCYQHVTITYSTELIPTDH